MGAPSVFHNHQIMLIDLWILHGVTKSHMKHVASQPGQTQITGNPKSDMKW